jgi:hypothetical protein
MLRGVARDKGPAHITFEALESFVRGPVAIGEGRVKLIHRFTQNIGLPTESLDGVGEISATLAKQCAVVQVAAEKAGLGEEFKDVSDAYALCCGLVHPSPLHLELTYPTGHPADMSSLIAGAVRSAAVMSISGVLKLMDMGPSEDSFIPDGLGLTNLVLSAMPVGSEKPSELILSSSTLDAIKIKNNLVKSISEQGDTTFIYNPSQKRAQSQG